MKESTVHVHTASPRDHRHDHLIELALLAVILLVEAVATLLIHATVLVLTASGYRPTAIATESLRCATAMRSSRPCTPATCAM